MPGLEVSGEIAALGEGVDGFALGDRVVALTNGGGYAEYVAVPAGQVLPLPRGCRHDRRRRAARDLLHRDADPGDARGPRARAWVLVHGAAGGIGGAAVRIARRSAHSPSPSSRQPRQAAYAKSLGAVAVIDRTREDFVARTMEITGGHGADRIVDIVGGDITGKNIEASAKAATSSSIGTLAGFHGGIGAGPHAGKQLTLSASTLRGQPPEVKAAIADRLRGRHLARGRGRPATAPHPALCRSTKRPRPTARWRAPGFIGKLVLVTRIWVQLRPSDRNFNCELIAGSLYSASVPPQHYGKRRAGRKIPGRTSKRDLSWPQPPC